MTGLERTVNCFKNSRAVTTCHSKPACVHAPAARTAPRHVSAP
ncbi:hypothetical protein [Streptomyces sp. NPDC002265]